MKVVDIVVLTIIIVIVGLIIYFSFWKNRKNLVTIANIAKTVIMNVMIKTKQIK